MEESMARALRVQKSGAWYHLTPVAMSDGQYSGMKEVGSISARNSGIVTGTAGAT